MKKQGGNIRLTLLVLISTCIAWGAAILVVPEISRYLIKDVTDCTLTDDACLNILSAYGATGDIFGAATALFTGLALFAVALTLAQDVKARREARKPFLIASLDEEAVILQDPEIGQKKKISYVINIKVTNQTSDAALNVCIKGILKAGNISVQLDTSHLQQPLNGSSSGDVYFKGNLAATETNSFLGELTETKRHATLELEVSYESLENVSWATSVIYELRCNHYGQREKLNSIRSDSDDYLELWKNDAAVALDTSVMNGSWKHSKA